MESDSTADVPLSERSLLTDIRLIFATILTDPGSSLAYGADALVHITVALVASSYTVGLQATLAAGAIIMVVYLIAILTYNSMSHHHTHPELGGGAYVSAFITASHIRHHPRIKSIMTFLGKTGTASLLADFPATQAISLIAGVEAMAYLIPVEDRLKWGLGFLVFLSFIQRYGLGNLAKYLIWPVIVFYVASIVINVIGIGMIAAHGPKHPVLPSSVAAANPSLFWHLVLFSVANGATLITGVEVGYSSVNIPYHGARAIRMSMWALYGIVLVTYSMQLANFLFLGIIYDDTVPLPIQIADVVGGPFLARGYGIVTAVMLLLAAQTAQTDFPLEVLRASRSNFFPRGIGDMAWKRTRRLAGMGGHEGLYNPRATILLGALTIVILLFFPTSHDIEGMYGLAVMLTMTIAIASYLLRQIRARRFSLVTAVAFVIMVLMLGNVLISKFFEGAWFILVLLVVYILLFVVSGAIYTIWREKMNLVPLELALAYPAFQNKEVDRHNILLVSKFHPGVIHFLKNYVRSGHIPLVVHFQTDAGEGSPGEAPPWYESIPVPSNVDTVTAIKEYVRKCQPKRIHLIPLLVKGVQALGGLYFGNSIDRLKYALSEVADVQVEFNRERVAIELRDILHLLFPRIFKAPPPKPAV
ncbi:MAG: KUP/HAK/KT family potassium transporter [Spirochaetia bacterium]|nr:KUP/HAK/KT family potassium transporter [Spirochaetia bacterium]